MSVKNDMDKIIVFKTEDENSSSFSLGLNKIITIPENHDHTIVSIKSKQFGCLLEITRKSIMTENMLGQYIEDLLDELQEAGYSAFGEWK